jgi:hypothetical protein
MAGAMTFDCFRPRDFVFPDGKRRTEALTLDQLNTSLDAGN